MKCFVAALVMLPAAAIAAESPWPPEDSLLVDRLEAIVNDEPVTRFELRRAAAPFIAKAASESRNVMELRGKLDQIQRDVLDNQINDILIYTEARKLNLTAQPERVTAHLERIRTANGWSEDEFAEQLRKLGFASVSDYRRHTEREMMKSQVIGIKVTSKVKVDDGEVERALQEALGADNSFEERRAAHILLQVDAFATGPAREAIKQRLVEARQQILDGETSFEDMARTISQDTNAAAGGDLGWFTKGDFDPDFETAAFKLKVGEISEPVLTQYGFHLIKVVELRAKSAVDEDALTKRRQQIRYELRQTAFQRLYDQWVKGLRSQAFIEVKDEELKPR